MSKSIDKKKANRVDEMREKKKQEQLNLPMNKFMNGDFSMAGKIRDHLLQHLDGLREDIRKIQVYIHQMKTRLILAKQYEHQLKTGVITELNRGGVKMDKDELSNAMVKNKIAAYDDVTDIRDRLVQVMMPKIDNDLFTAKQYNDYAEDVDAKIKEIGFDLFPGKLEINKVE